MNRQQLSEQIFSKGTYLCVGLDTDINKIPQHLRNRPDALLEFNKRIIDATKDYCVAYKINTAFYEVYGSKGWDVMEQTVAYIPATHFTIADAKRGDIGNTSAQYARAFFETLNFDAITVAPYMGEDSIRPFLEYAGKWTIVLGLTSNKGAEDFERQPCGGQLLYEQVLTKVSSWGNPENLMFVVGATQASAFENIRQHAPEHFYLVPGVGAQGGSLEDVSQLAMTADCGLLVNASRAVIYAGDGEDFAEMAGTAARQYAEEMKPFLKR